MLFSRVSKKPSSETKEDIQSLEQRKIGTPCRSHHNSDGNPRGSGAKRKRISRHRREMTKGAHRLEGVVVQESPFAGMAVWMSTREVEMIPHKINRP